VLDVAPGSLAQRLGLRGWRRTIQFMGLAALLVLGVAAVVAQRQRARDRAEIAATATFFDRNGQRIRYQLEGASHAGPTVVLLSGYTGTLEQWEAAQQKIMKDVPVLIYDRGGYGLSDPPQAYDANAQADELADLASLKAVKPPLIVVGFSSSGLIARAFARRHREMLGGLLLLDPTHPEQIVDLSRQDLYARRVLYERNPLVSFVKRCFRQKSYTHSRPPTAAELRADEILNFPSHWWAAYREGAVIETSAREAAEVEWKKVKAPVTLLSVTSPEGSPEWQERHRLNLRLAAQSGAKFVNPKGFTHDQVHGDPAFLPHIVDAVTDLVAKARAGR